MATLKLDYQQDDYESLQEGELSIKEFLNEVLFSGSYNDESPEDDLIGLLLAYHSDEGGAPLVSDLELDDVEYDEEKGRGKAYFSYLLEYHFACSDMDSERTVEETVDFVIDEESAEVTFTFIDLTTRSTADEF